MPVFVDIDESLTMDPAAAEAAITPRTVAIVPVHMRGAGRRHGPPRPRSPSATASPSWRTPPRRSADCTGAGASGTFGKIGAFSLQYHKTITTGEGGMLVSDDTALFERAVRYHDQGSVRVEELDELIPEGSPLIIGVNYRMSELTAAVGVAQLGKMDWIIGQMRAAQGPGRPRQRRIPGLRLRPLPDPAGETGATLIFSVAVGRRRDAPSPGP